ncbi:unnamed protein product [Cyclocybe aegerita]|uniref:Uncharacterized protein n=1 Tax=Cyclocybe aegerita TaxID=1973307 RepID=A0A8S0W1H8_CYCAE|nr:unnamed protein product [Cyclocybe aegerita]
MPATSSSLGTVPSDRRSPPQAIPPPSRFLRIRTVSFSVIISLCFLWIILLCLIIFSKWDLLDRTERPLVVIMLLIDTITVIVLPILLIQPFRAWLDAARFLFLFAAHCGIAGGFASKTPSFQCSSSVPDEVAICNLIILFINVCSWFVPILVVGYACGLAFLMYRLSKSVEASAVDDVEKQKSSVHNSFHSQVSYGYAI